MSDRRRPALWYVFWLQCIGANLLALFICVFIIPQIINRIYPDIYSETNILFNQIIWIIMLGWMLIYLPWSLWRVIQNAGNVNWVPWKYVSWVAVFFIAVCASFFLYGLLVATPQVMLYK